MLETIKSLLLASLGAAVLTKDKAMEFLEQSVAQGKMSTQEAERLAEELVAESKRQARAWGDKASQAVDKAAVALNLVQRSELEALERRLAKLESDLDALRRRMPPEG